MIQFPLIHLGRRHLHVLRLNHNSFHQVHKKTEMTPDLYLSESIAVHYYQEVKQEIEKL